MALSITNILDQKPSLKPETSLKLIHYPKGKQQDVIISDLALVHKDAMPKNSGGLRQLITHQYTYSIVFTQIEKGEVFLAVLLHQGDDIKESESFFDKIHTTLQPLVRNGSLKLNKALLKESLLPSPLPPNELTAHLVDVMEKHTDLHPQWHKVIQTLLHSACRRCSRDEVTKLLSKGGDIEEEDSFGNTPLHTAASEVSAEGMKWLMSVNEKKLKKRRSSLELLSHRNSNGKSPAEIAVESNNYSALSQMMKVGGLPLLFGMPEAPKQKSTNILHTAVKNNSSDSIKVIVEEKNAKLFKRQSTTYFSPTKVDSPASSTSSDEPDTSLDHFDDDGYTPLMLAAEKGYINSCLYLLLGGADPNIRNPDTGDTSLHLAVAQGHIYVAKLLLVFKASPLLVNHKGEKATDKCAPSEVDKFKFIFEELVPLLESGNIVSSNSATSHPVKPDSLYLLSLDGGGVRGVLLIQMLLALQNRMKELDPTSLSPLYYFDYFALTGIGCYPALYTFYGQVTLETCLILCLTDTLRLLGGSDHSHRTEAIIETVKSQLGADTLMADVKYPRMIVTTTLADRIPCDLHLITNYGEARNGQKGPSERKVWEAAIMAAAAPMYFKPFEGKFLDGTIMGNNPTMKGIVEILRQGQEEEKPANIGCVVSLGTGIQPVQYVDNIEIKVPTFSLSSLKDIPNILSAVRNFASIVREQVTKSDGEEIIRAKTICKALGSSYYRLTPQLRQHTKIADTEFGKVIDLMFDCHLYILKEAEYIDQIAHHLLSRPPNLQSLFRSLSDN